MIDPLTPITISDILRTLLSLGLLMSLPGWGLISFFSLWRRWPTLQRWIIAIGLSIAFYPLLFYWARALWPSLQLGPYKIQALLIAFAGVILWNLRRSWAEALFSFTKLEWLALSVFFITLATRFFLAWKYPYPAWSDSLHHTLLTQIVAQQGQLPATLGEAPLAMYHLGLYAITGPVAQIARVPAHTALVWTAQVLNGLCGLGAYLVLDRHTKREGAIAGAVVAGLLSQHPAWYFNWGRFTQLASQTIILIAWGVLLETLLPNRPTSKVKHGFMMAMSSMLLAGVFFLHYRVAVFLIPLLLLSVVYAVKKNPAMIKTAAIIGVASFILIAPAFIPAMSYYLEKTLFAPKVAATPDLSYFQFYLTSVPYLVAPLWLIVITALAMFIGLAQKNKMVVAMVVWAMSWLIMGNLYRIGVRVLNFTNLGAVLIAFYLPISVTIGNVWGDLSTAAQRLFNNKMAGFQIGVLILAVLVGAYQRTTRSIEPFRFFVQPDDLKAMAWIRENTPPNALFAIDTYLWLSNAPHGIDGGYWIPYFTGRRTTTGHMLSPLSGDQQLVETARIIQEATKRPAAITDLCEYGVKYVYAKPSSRWGALDAQRLAALSSTQVRLQVGEVTILQICNQ